MDEDFDDIHPAILALRTVCRCNNVKYRTIEKAILQGARTISDVAAKTTATTGHCGGSCTPKVQMMIERLAEPPAPEAGAGEEDAWWIRPAREKQG